MMRMIGVLAMLTCLLSGCEDTRPPINQAVGWFRPYGQLAEARCVGWLESNNNPYATGLAGERGIFQIHPIHRRDFERYTGHPWSDAYNANLNGMYALHLWRDGDGYRPPRGWSQWSTSRYCHR